MKSEKCEIPQKYLWIKRFAEICIRGESTEKKSELTLNGDVGWEIKNRDFHIAHTSTQS